MAAAVEKVVAEFEQLSPEQQKEALRLLKQKLNGSASHQAASVKPARRNERTREYAWLERHRAEYLDQWVALDGDRLISHGPTLAHVRREATAQGLEDALMILIETAAGPQYHHTGKADRVVAVNVPMPDLSLEHAWLEQHAHKYPGEWLALKSDTLISHSLVFREVVAETKKQGIESPYFIRVDSPDDLPWAGF